MRARLLLAALVVACCGAADSRGGDGVAGFDLDRWHAERGGFGIETDEHRSDGFSLGLYPGVSGILGLPGGYAGAVDLFVSLSDGRSTSVFAGYGREWAATSESSVWTLGWGGVRRVPSAEEQLGFFGTFLRYRELRHERHGLHRGLSVGTESGVGRVAITMEAGLARSDRDHWLVVARLALKLALPLRIPLGGNG